MLRLSDNPHRRRRARPGLVLGVLAGLVLAPGQTQALRFKYPVLIQLTHNTMGDVQEPSLRLEPPQRVTFVSDGDVLGPGTEPGHREVFQYDLDTRSLLRFADSSPGESFAASRPTDIMQTSRPEYTAFVSTGNLDPSVGNADGNPEIFIRIQTTGEIHQITDTAPPVVNSEPYPSDSGRCIVFSSTGDLNDNTGVQDPNNPVPEGGPFSNLDGSQEVFLMQMDNALFPEPGSYTQLSDGPLGSTSSRPVIGGFYYPRQCNSTFFQSDYEQAPGGHTGHTEIYEYVRSRGQKYVLAAQEIPFPNQYPPPGDYRGVGMSSASNFARGPFAVFQTSADVWNNGNAAPNLFRFRSFHPRMTQYTAVDLPAQVRDPVISDGGRWIAFESNANLIRALKAHSPAPLHEHGNFEIWRMQKRRRIMQITDSPLNCDNTQASINDKGLNVAFRSTCDLIPGRNPNNVPQVFLYLQVKGDDPLACEKGGCTCYVADGCCNVANGCYRPINGKTHRVPKKNCLVHERCD